MLLLSGIWAPVRCVIAQQNRRLFVPLSILYSSFSKIAAAARLACLLLQEGCHLLRRCPGECVYQFETVGSMRGATLRIASLINPRHVGALNSS